LRKFPENVTLPNEENAFPNTLKTIVTVSKMSNMRGVDENETKKKPET
jgi:hypothetical protein